MAFPVAVRQAGKADQQNRAYKLCGICQAVQVVGQAPSAYIALCYVNSIVLLLLLMVGFCILETEPSSSQVHGVNYCTSPNAGQ